MGEKKVAGFNACVATLSAVTPFLRNIERCCWISSQKTGRFTIGKAKDL
jgi:hypothetical protein